jgi:hypothetical protein
VPLIQSKDLIETPGPGQYEPVDKLTKGSINPSWSVSKELRDKNYVRSTQGPGPTSYTIPSKIVEGPQYHLGIKPIINPQKNRTTTGPGHYNPRGQSANISYSLR